MYYKRFLHDKLISPQSHNKIRLIFGARQVGKTVLMKNILPKKRSVLFNLQDSRLRRRYENDPGVFSRELNALSPDFDHIFIDEIQKVPALLDEVQFLYDQDKTRFQFFLTGSSARKLRTSSANLLPGRIHVFNLYPVSSIEESGFHSNLNIGKNGIGGGFPGRDLEKKLLFGNLPGFS